MFLSIGSSRKIKRITMLSILGFSNLVETIVLFNDGQKEIEMTQDMPASYKGDALGGSDKPDGVNRIVKVMLERGAKMIDIQERLVKLGKAQTAARAHLTFLNKCKTKLFVNGQAYCKGQMIGPDDFITLK